MPKPLSTGKSGMRAHKNWNLLLPCLSIFIAVPKRFETVMKTSAWGTSLRKALAKSSKSIQRSLSIGTLAQDPCPLIDTGCEVRKPFVDTSLAGDGFYVGCRKQFQFICRTVKKDTGYLVPVCIGYHGILVFGEVLLHPMCLHVT